MIVASQLRAGMAIRYEGPSYKVIAAEYHPGQGQMGGATLMTRIAEKGESEGVLTLEVEA